MKVKEKIASQIMDVLKNFAIFIENQPCWSPFLIKRDLKA